MENLCLKFPYLCSMIFANLDNKSLVQCRLVNKSWKKLIENEKILWKRILKKYITNLTSKCWYEILIRIPVDIIREIATAVNHTFMSQLQGWHWEFNSIFLCMVKVHICRTSNFLPVLLTSLRGWGKWGIHFFVPLGFGDQSSFPRGLLWVWPLMLWVWRL